MVAGANGIVIMVPSKANIPKNYEIRKTIFLAFEIIISYLLAMNYQEETTNTTKNVLKVSELIGKWLYSIENIRSMIR
jgi:hypothetical protein